MLTEYSSYDDIRKFRKKVLEKYEDMKDGWLGEEIDKWMLHNRKKHETYMVKTFMVDGQKIQLEMYPAINGFDRISKKTYSFALGTAIETRNGKMWYSFAKNNNEIHVYSPHYFKRHKERFNCESLTDFNNTEIVPYKRNGRDYELWVCFDSVMIIRRKEDFVYHITFLHKDKCTGRHYQNLFERVGKAIDEHDIYEWK